MDNTDQSNLADEIDNDKGLISQRRLLVTMSILLLALNFSGAKIKEANTFIFKIEFANHSGLKYLLILSVFFLMLRYYAYAQKYHRKAFELWSKKLLEDYTIFNRRNYPTLEITGLLSKIIDISSHMEPDIKNLLYEKKGVFRRKLIYEKKAYDEEYGDYYSTQHIELNHFSENWKIKDMCNLLMMEFRSRIDILVKNREYQELIFPYALGFSALISSLFGSFLKFGQ